MGSSVTNVAMPYVIYLLSEIFLIKNNDLVYGIVYEGKRYIR